MAEEEDRPSSGFAKDPFAPARKLAVSSGTIQIFNKNFGGNGPMVRAGPHGTR